MNLQDFILGLEDKIGNLRQDVIEKISVIASEDELLSVVRNAGILEGVTTTKEELAKFLRGDDEQEEN
jgi:predicted translin family RNA/ssDNA-binding protein